MSRPDSPDPARRRVLRRDVQAWGLVAFAALALGGCGRPRATRSASITSGAGGATSGDTSTGGSGGATVGSSSAGSGAGGGGGAACPVERGPCHTAADAGVIDACCAEQEICCSASFYGYAGSDLCLPAGKACPVGCPDGSTCDDGNQCLLDPTSGKYQCVSGCTATQACTATLCCPLGAQCVEGHCALVDLTVDPKVLADSVSLGVIDSLMDPCTLVEHCLAGDGLRDIINFTARTMNVGPVDLVIGDPVGNPNFVFSPCHMHYHFADFAEYDLLDMSSNVVVKGRKQGFAIRDGGMIDAADPNSSHFPKYDIGNQGIQHGWFDEYASGIPCQWMDVTGVPPGDYILRIEVNPSHRIAESDYSNNMVAVPVTIP